MIHAFSTEQMMTLQVVTVPTNQRSLCIGEITTKEAESAIGDDPSFDGHGLYLVAVDVNAPRQPAAVLAKFVSEEAAATLAQFLRTHGHLERA